MRLKVKTLCLSTIIKRNGLYKKLYDLTLSNFSWNKRYLEFRKINGWPIGQSKKDKAILVYLKEEIIGWGILANLGNSKKFVISLFVKEEYRRRGIGSIICKVGQKNANKNIFCFPYDSSTRLFYRRNKIKVLFSYDDINIRQFSGKDDVPKRLKKDENKHLT